MHTLAAFRCAVAATVVSLTATSTNAQQQYHGILMNGISGTQLYDPFNAPHAQGNLHLALQNGTNAQNGAAAISGHLAYFASGDGDGV
jgi:hypothetical protein